MRTYCITIQTLNNQTVKYEIESDSMADEIATRLFNQTPNVRGVTVNPSDD